MEKEMDPIWLPKGVVLQKNYQIRKKIAISEHSIVYLGYDLMKQKHCIIKEYFPHKIVLRDLDDKTVVCRKFLMKEKYHQASCDFLNEFQIVEKYNHPSIVKGIASFGENNTSYIVLEYYRGKTLDRYIESEKEISIARFLHKIYIPLIDTVRLIHQDGIIHRDLKPSNIIITSQGVPVIIDFGSALYYQKLQKKRIFVTPGFSPIEYYSEKSRQGRYSDLYSMAAILYYYLSGQIPLIANNRLHEDRIEHINHLCGEISKIFGFVIMKNLAFEGQKRFNNLNFLKIFVVIEWWWQRIKTGLRKN